jgi:hypothetical protein
MIFGKVFKIIVVLDFNKAIFEKVKNPQNGTEALKKNQLKN